MSRSILSAAVVLLALPGVFASAQAEESPRWWVIAEEPEGRCAMYPYLLRLQNGDLLCAYYSQKWETDRRYALFRQEHLDPPRPESPRGGQIRLIRSADQGKTWSEAQVLADTPHDDRDANLCQLPDGRVLCSWFAIWRWPGRGYNSPPPGENALYALFISESSDNGLTWSTPRRVLDRPGLHPASGSAIRVLSDGSLIWPIYHYDNVEKQGRWAYAATVRSTDGGMSWGDLAVIGQKPEPPLYEADVVELKDGRLLAVSGRSYAHSADKGKTWSDLETLDPGVGQPFLLRTGKGALLLAYSANLRASFDEGRTWGESWAVSEIGHYLRVAELDDGTFLGTHNEYGRWSRIRAIRFRLSAEGQFQNVSPEPVAVATAWIPTAHCEENYFARLSVSGGRAPFHWSIADGNLPDGLSLNPSVGMVYGVPKQVGSAALTVCVADAEGASTTRKLSLRVEAAQEGK